MTSKNDALTPEEVKSNLRSQGKTLAQFAEEQGFTVNDVYRVMNGSRKGYYGKGHDIAVALGLKPKPQTENSNID